MGINNVGSVDDIRCSLNFIQPQTYEYTLASINRLKSAIDDEKRHRNRLTVIKIIESKIRQLEKLKLSK